MINYADYGFYQTNYKGSLSIDLFNSLIVRASRIIDRNINRKLDSDKIESLSDEDKYMLKYVACSLCDYVNEDRNVTSVSIDGVSKTYKDNSKEKLNKILDNLPQELTRYL